MRTVAATLALAIIFSTAALADEVADSRRLQQEALAARKDQQPQVFLSRIAEAAKLRPQHPALLLLHASALAANDRPREALALIDRVASMGLVYSLDAPELAPLRAMPGYIQIATRLAANANPIGTARQAFAIDRLGLIPEGLAYDVARKRWLVSSVRSGAVLAIDLKGKVTTLTDVPWGVCGIAVDARRGLLWATTSALGQVEGLPAADKGKSALLKIDLASGKVLETLLPRDKEPHTFADVVVAPSGEVFVSDSEGPVMFRVAGSMLEPFVRGPFLSMQGIAPSGDFLYVADYTKGLFVVDLRTREIRPVRVPPTASLLGVDGIYAVDERTLVATQNGTSPNRIIRIRLAQGGMAVSSVETMLANVPALGDPTLGVVVGKRFYFNANAQWDQFADDGRIKDPLQLKPAVVLSLPVD